MRRRNSFLSYFLTALALMAIAVVVALWNSRDEAQQAQPQESASQVVQARYALPGTGAPAGKAAPEIVAA